ncbi:MAG: hypothetical protein ABSC71_04665 [Candidatus Acidiferrales bacterium]
MMSVWSGVGVSMRRCGRWLACGALLAAVLVGARPCFAQSPEKIVDEYIRAIGGEKAVATQRTTAISGSVRVKSEGGGGQDEDLPDTSGTYSLVVKAPNKFYSEFGVGAARDVVAFNGKSGWQKRGADAAVTLTGPGAAECEAEARYLNGKLVHLKRDKIGVRLVGTADVRSQTAYQIELAFSPSVKRELFFDTGTHLLVREIAPAIGMDGDAAAGRSQNVQIDYFDYRPVSGVLEPQSMEVTRGGKTYTIAVTHVDFNGSVNDAIFNFPSNDTRPLPDIPQLLRDMNKNQRAIEEIQKHYTCHLTVEELKVDSRGDVTSKTVKEYDLFFVGEDEVRHLLAKDGKPLEGDEKKKEDERFSKEFDELKKKQAELANDPKKQEKQQERDDEQISDFLRAESFTNPRREIFRGHEVIVFDFAANPDYKARNLNEAIAQKLGGVIWVDEDARDVARLEARFIDTAKIGGGLVGSISKGANLVIEQAKVNDEVWLPTYAEVHATARVAFVHLKANEIDRYTDYRKFGSEVKLGTSTPLDAPNATPQATPSSAPPAPSAPTPQRQNQTPEKPQ